MQSPREEASPRGFSRLGTNGQKTKVDLGSQIFAFGSSLTASFKQTSELKIKTVWVGYLRSYPAAAPFKDLAFRTFQAGSLIKWRLTFIRLTHGEASFSIPQEHSGGIAFCRLQGKVGPWLPSRSASGKLQRRQSCPPSHLVHQPFPGTGKHIE